MDIYLSMLPSCHKLFLFVCSGWGPIFQTSTTSVATQESDEDGLNEVRKTNFAVFSGIKTERLIMGRGTR